MPSILVHFNSFFRLYLYSADSLLSILQTTMKIMFLPLRAYTLSLDVNIAFVLE